MTEPHILVLEDDNEVRTMLTMVLQDQGYRVTAVDRGEKAVAQAREHSFDLIVADIRMEGMDGLEAIEKAKLEQPQMGTLVVSGYASEEETARASALQVGGYLRKPFKIEELLGLVRRQLAGKAQAARRQEDESAQQRLLRWALQAAARFALDAGEVDADVVAAGQLAKRLALASQMDPAAAAEVEVGTLIAGLADCSSSPLSEEIRQGIAGIYSEAISSDRETPESAMATLALYAHGTRGEALGAEQIALQQPSRWTSELLSRYAGLPSDPAELRAKRATTASMLALARTLEQVGDVSNAWTAYQELQEPSSTAKERVEACLGQARLAFTQGDTEKAVQRAGEAVKLAQARGPVAHARTMLEAGILLAEQRHARALAVLKEAAGNLEKVGLPGGHAQAGLAICMLSHEESPEPYLDVLFQAENAHELSSISKRMMGSVLQQAARIKGEKGLRWLVRLSSNFPKELASSLSTGMADVTKRALLEALEDSGRFVPESTLELMSQDPDPDIRRRASALARIHKGESVLPLLMAHSTGRFEVWLGGETIPEREWKTQKVRALFAILASQWGKPFQDEVLTDMLWPDSGEKGRKNLWWSTSMIRSCLRRSQDASRVLVREGDILRLDSDCPHWHDVDELKKAYAQGKKAIEEKDLESAVVQLGRIPALYRGPYMDGCFFDWALELRWELSRKAMQGLALLGKSLLTLKRYYQAMEIGQRILEVDPHAQEGHLVMMRAYIGLGQPEGAIKQFEVCADALQREYELDPTPELVAVLKLAKGPSL
jgi:two-component SAPR family response regulator